MKIRKTYYALAFLFCAILNVDKAFSQATSATANAPIGASDFLGWTLGTQTGAVLTASGTFNFATSPELIIKNEDPMSISFYTNDNASLSNLRMWIKDDGGGSTTTDARNNDGFIGIGDFSVTTGTGTTPQELLHLININDQGDDLFEQFTNNNTTHSAKQGLLVGLNYAPNYAGGLTNPGDFSFAKIIQEEDAPMKFYTLDSARMIINSNYSPTIHSSTVNTNGYVGIGLPYFWQEELGIAGASEGPRSLLHLQGPYNAYIYGGLGWRYWNKTGVYINENSDEMYVGLKNEFALNGTNRSDAVIMWGDDQTTDDNGDCFRIIFSGANTGNGNGSHNQRDPQTLNGLETVRITSFGRMGIGPLFDWNNQPCRRLEILDLQQKSNGASMNEPQLRLTYTQATGVTLGKWTDFQTTGSGDLFIKPNNVSAPGNVGIQTSTPGNTLEIKSPGTTIRNDGLGSGLRFSNMNNSVNPQTNPDAQKGVLSVDNNGDVIFVTDETGGGNVSACGGGGLNNYVPLFTNPGGTTICNSIMLQGSYSAAPAIGVGYTAGTLYGKLDVDGDLNLSQSSSSKKYKIYGLNVLHITDGSSGGNNLFAGASTGDYNTGHDNTLIGAFLGDQISTPLSGNYNTLIGSAAGLNLSTADYSFIGGYNAGVSLTTGDYNTIIGAAAGAALSSQAQNVMIGYQAGNVNEGDQNILIGYQAATANNNTGSVNTIIGWQSGYGLTTGCRNSMVGNISGFHNEAGDNNVYEGYQAGYQNYGDPTQGPDTLAGDNNVFVGCYSGQITAQYTKNSTYLGASAGSYNTGILDNAAAIGAHSMVYCSDCMVLGSTPAGPINQVHVGIGYGNPTGTITANNFLLYVNSETDADTGTFQNSAYFNGRICAQGIWTFSDSALKNNIQTLDPLYSRTVLDNLNPKIYTYDIAGNPQLRLPSGNQAGLIAEEVEQTLPELVATMTAPAILDSIGNIVHPEKTFKALNYVGIIPYLIQGLKDQQQKIDAMQTQIDNCCNAGNRHIKEDNGLGSSGINIELKNAKSIILNQNVPNPFAEQTTITYFITDDVSKAQIFFYDNKGTILKTVEINEKGEGQINVYAADLSSGLYTYSLIADGKLVETKKMVKTN